MCGGKLVRDLTPQIIRERGAVPIVRAASPGEYRVRLLVKLAEETGEVITADEASMPGELADVLEVIHALARDLGVGFERIEALRVAKRQERGGFEGGTLWYGNRAPSVT